MQFSSITIKVRKFVCAGLCAKGPKVGEISLAVKPVRDLSKASLNLKRSLWGDKPEGLLPENCPNFLFFYLGRDVLIMTIPKGARKTTKFKKS
jgi:hypothetical protein